MPNSGVADSSRPKERRRSVRPRLTISQILEMMQQIADDEYNGDLANNIWKIFNELQIDERRTFLRKSIDALWEKQVEFAKNGLQEIVLSDEETKQVVRINPVEVQTERTSIEQANYREQSQLKNWFIRFGFTLLMLTFIGMLVFSFFYGSSLPGGGKTLNDTLGNLNNFIDLLFKSQK